MDDKVVVQNHHELTSFQPLSPEPASNSTSFLWRLFGFSRAQQKEQETQKITQPHLTASQQRQESVNRDVSTLKEKTRSPVSQPKAVPSVRRKSGSMHMHMSGHGMSGARSEITPPKRTLQTVLHTIGNMTDVQRGAQPKETLKQYWMPDEHCKSCYDCREVFNTFRRRHHCRVCGQIFCSRCCWETIPGHLMGMAKDLRVCNYCVRIVRDYTHSSGAGSVIRMESRECAGSNGGTPVRRHCSIDSSINEEKGFRSAFDGDEFMGKTLRPTTLPHIRLDNGNDCSPPPDIYTPIVPSALQFGSTPQKSIKGRGIELREVWLELQKPEHGLLQAHRYRLRSYPNTLVASEIVDWLLERGCAGPNRSQACVLGQALLDSKRIEHMTGEVLFKDEYTLYRPGLIGTVEIAEVAKAKQRENTDDDMGPEWFRSLSKAEVGSQSPSETSNTDDKYAYSDDDTQTSAISPNPDSIPAATSDTKSTELDDDHTSWPVGLQEQLNSSDTVVSESGAGASTLQAALTNLRQTDSKDSSGFVNPEQRYLFTSLRGQQKHNSFECFLRSALRVADSGGVTAGGQEVTLRDNQNQRIAIERLNRWHKNHVDMLLWQQLWDVGLPKEWFNVVHDIAHMISRKVRPKFAVNDHIDLRKYVKYKKIPDKTRSFSYISGIVFTKTVAHKKMASTLRRPKILLLRCALEYERVENKFSSLDLLVMQEAQHLKSLVDRIKNLNPDIVLVEKSVSQLARDYLHKANIVLVFNVKRKVMERLARCTQASLVTAIDQLQFDSVRLGRCELFKLCDYVLPNGKPKPLMSFEGCAESLGCTVILQGDKQQLPVVKKLLNTAVLASYNLLMEMQLHLDMFAMPPPFDPALYSEVKATISDKMSRVTTPTLYPCIPDDEYRLEDELLIDESATDANSDDNIQGERNEEVDTHEGDDRTSAVCVVDVATVGVDDSHVETELTRNVVTEGLAGDQDVEARNDHTDLDDRETVGKRDVNTRVENADEEGQTQNIELTPDCYTNVNDEYVIDNGQQPRDPLWTLDPSDDGDEPPAAVSLVDAADTPSADIRATHSPWDDQLSCSPLLQSIAYGTQFIVSTDDTSDQLNVSIAHLLPDRPSCFLRCLMQVLLTLSPHITFPLPYVETAAGSLSNVRPFLPNIVYFSKRFKPQEQAASSRLTANRQPSCTSTDLEICKEKEWGDPHPFVTEVIKEPLSASSCAAQLANFRAFGGRVGVENKSILGGCSHGFVSPVRKPVGQLNLARDDDGGRSYGSSLHTNGNMSSEQTTHNLPDRNATQPSIPRPVKYEGKIDCLDIENHQQLLVLFSSQSSASNNAPNPCIHPWVVTMGFYGQNDIALGHFLNHYCFRFPFRCSVQVCGADMVKHQRHFVHGRGVIRLVLEHMEKPVAGFEDKILCWTWCKRCRQTTPVSTLSDEAQAFSFAKYLELRFYARNYGCYQLSDIECHHSLHQDHVHFFSFGRIIASFEHQTMCLLEVVIPAVEMMLETHGYEVFSWHLHLDQACNYFMSFHRVVEDRLNEMATLTNLPNDIVEQIELMRKHLEGEKSEVLNNTTKLRNRAEKFGLISRTGNESPYAVSHMSVFEMVDACNELKRACVDRVNYWNRTLCELHLRKTDKGRRAMLSKLSKTASSLPLSRDDMDQYDIVRIEKSPLSTSTESGLESETQNHEESNSEQSSHNQRYSDSKEQRASMSPDRSGSRQTDEMSSSVAIREVDQLSVELSGVVSSFLASTSSSSKSVKYLKKTTSSNSIASAPILIEQSEKSKSKRNASSILSRFLPDSSFQPLPSPLPATEHHGLPMTRAFPVPVYDSEPSSIVAYTLSSKEYYEKLRLLQCVLEHNASEQNRSRLSSPRGGDDVIAASLQEDYYTQPTNSSGCSTPVASSTKDKESIKSSILSFFRPASSSLEHQGQGEETSRSGDSEEPSDRESSDFRDTSPSSDGTRRKSSSSGRWTRNSRIKSEEDVSNGGVDETDLGMSTPVMSDEDQQHITYQYPSENYKFYCRVYFAEQFRKYREVVFPDGEDRFVRSLSRCCVWAARGGKSGSKFCKTFDDRFIVKQLSRSEMQSFKLFAQHYFEYMENAHRSKDPTVIAKILGVYTIGFKNSHTNTSLRQDILIMENLFYGRQISRIFDLKGSERNRYVQSKGQNEVLMDENLLEFVCESPLFIRPHAKNVLTRSILNDTAFLAKQFVMDYSLLVGIDETRSEIIVGIIDFIRTFTLDKRLEMWVKSTGLLGGHGKMPTVVSPDVYRKRFCEAMDRYFLMVPDKWSAVGADVDWECREFD